MSKDVLQCLKELVSELDRLSNDHPQWDGSPMRDECLQAIENAEKDEWVDLSKLMACGGCGKHTTVDSEYSCKDCGCVLCGLCGELCKSHTTAHLAEEQK